MINTKAVNSQGVSKVTKKSSIRKAPKARGTNFDKDLLVDDVSSEQAPKEEVSVTESESEDEPIQSDDSEYKYAGRKRPSSNSAANLQTNLLPPQGFMKAGDES